MLSEVSVSSTSASQREAQREAPSKSPTPLRTTAKEPPPYGAQHRQDALWEGKEPPCDTNQLAQLEAGGNKSLPPRWHQFKVSDVIQYQDDTLTMVSWNRPLPGVRLDVPGDLVVSECEWHISPLGRSYFVNHNTRTTSWRKPKPERPAGSLAPECIIEAHSKCIWSLAYLTASCSVMSASDDGSIRQWKMNGEPVGKPFNSDGGGIGSMSVSPDETMVICGSVDGRLRLWNIKEGSMIGDPWEGHNAAVKCLDWSINAPEIASGSEDGTIRRWNPDTARQIAPPMKTSHGWVIAFKYSPQGDKFISGSTDGVVCVWSKDGGLLKEIKGHEKGVTSLRWSKDGTHIFSASGDNTIRKWRMNDGEELVVLRGHTNPVRSLCLSPNEGHIVSASDDCSIRIWDLKTNQPVGDPLLHDDRVFIIAISPDGKYIASTGLDRKIYVWSLEAALNRNSGDQVGGRPAQPRVVRQPIANTRGSARYGNDFFADNSNRPPANSSLLHWRNLFGFLQFSAWPTDEPRPSPRKSQRWNLSLLPVRKSRRAVVVAPARDEDRYGITPESDAEAAAAMQRTNGNEADNLMQSGQPAVWAQAPQVQLIQTQVQGSTASGGAEDVVYEGVSCCGCFFGRRRSTSPRS